MTHPYRNQPEHIYWKQAVAQIEPDSIDPIVTVPFTITPDEPVATAGSCFAQHIAKSLQKQGYNYLVSETAPEGVDAQAENYGTFTARFGNVYTVRQLLQLFNRAYGLFNPVETVWQLEDGTFVDPFRPRVQSKGWSTPEEVEADTESHLAQVRSMFEDCSVFVFTLGLTEGWINVSDGSVYPLAPGAVFDCDDSKYRFENFKVGEMVADLTNFIGRLAKVNPSVRLILTVSPVPLIATAANAHVLQSNTYSKAALRVVAEEVTSTFDNVAYFPSYEIIAGPQAKSAYYEADLRSVKDVGVAHVMSVFGRHFLTTDGEAQPQSIQRVTPQDPKHLQDALAQFAIGSSIICDEETLVDGD